MSVFTKRINADLSRCNSISVKLDSKGRISIPSFLRKNLGVKTGDSLELVFDLKKNYFSMIVQNGVVGSTKACEAFSSSSNLDSGLRKIKRSDLYER